MDILPPTDMCMGMRLRNNSSLATNKLLSTDSLVIFQDVPEHQQQQLLPPHKNVRLLFAVGSSTTMDVDDVTRKITTAVNQGYTTAIGLFDRGMYKDCCDPILTANTVATLIDRTGGGDFIWLEPNDVVLEDSILPLCEELCYLDLPGPIVSSRLVVSVGTTSSDDDTATLLEECMHMGVNKFILSNVEKASWTRDRVEDEGKKIVTLAANTLPRVS